MTVQASIVQAPTLLVNTNVHCFEAAGLGKAPFKFVGMSESKYQAIPGDPNCPIQPGTSCDYCATGIMYVCHILSADGKTFKVGSDCVRRTGDAGLYRQAKAALVNVRKALAQVKRNTLLKAMREEREATRAASLKAYTLAHPEFMEAIKVNHPIINDIRARWEAGGMVSEKQHDLVIRLAKDANEVKTAAPTGKVTFTGTVVSVKAHDSAYGVTWKMTVKVKTDTGAVWLSWGTVPTAVMRACVDSSGYFGPECLRGKQIELKATLELGNDPSFVFMKRPSGKLV